MSRKQYGRWWYPGTMDAIRRYHRLGTTGLERDWKNAIEKSIKEFETTEEGKTALKVVSMTMIRHTHTLQGAADNLYISYRTARRYRIKFIYSVGRNMGYKE